MQITIRLFLFSQILCCGFLHIGFGIGFSSPTLREILNLGILNEATYPVFTSLFVVGLAIGPILTIPGSKYLGRKLVAILSGIPSTFGLLLIAGAINPGFLLVGRLFHGVGAGMLIAVIPVYLGEITPPNRRGLLSSFGGVYEVVGLLIVYLFGIFLSFRWLAIVGVLLSVLQTFALLLVPQSATWLYSRGLEKRAKCALESVRRKGESVLPECNAIRAALDSQKEKTLPVLYDCKLIFAKYRMKALAVGIILALGFMNTGVDIVYSYTSPLLESSGGIDPNIIAMVVPLFGIAGSMFAIFLVEPIGRKPLLLTSAVGVTVSLVSLTCYFLLGEYFLEHSIKKENGTGWNEMDSNWIILWPGLSIAFYSFANKVGWGSVFYVILGEILPIKIKEVGSGIFHFVLNVHAISILTAFPYINGVIGNGYTFLILVIANILSCIFILFFLPETKGLKADEIEELFQENSLLCGLNYPSHSYTVGDKQNIPC